MTMPYRADVIGSLLRPRYLSEARAALADGRMSNEDFKRIEDRAVDQAIAMQEGCGLDVVNDGELRRFSFLDHLLGAMEGVSDMPGAAVHFHAPDPAQDWDWRPPFTVTGRIRPKGPMMTIEEFSYARGLFAAGKIQAGGCPLIDERVIAVREPLAGQAGRGGVEVRAIRGRREQAPCIPDVRCRRGWFRAHSACSSTRVVVTAPPSPR